MRITSKGQVTIPRNLREEFGFLPYTEVEFIVEDGAVRIVKAPPGERSRGNSSWNGCDVAPATSP